MDRYYPDYDVTIRDSIAATLCLWNSNEEYLQESNDFLFVQFLLIDIFGGAALAKDGLDEIKLKFVQEIFEIRVNYDNNRTSKLNEYMQTVKKQFIKKMNQF